MSLLFQTRDWFLLVRSEPEFRSASSAFSYYILQSSASLTLLLKPVLTRELMLPCDLPVSNEDPPLNTLGVIEVHTAWHRIHFIWFSMYMVSRSPCINQYTYNCCDSIYMLMVITYLILVFLYLHINILTASVTHFQPLTGVLLN